MRPDQYQALHPRHLWSRRRLLQVGGIGILGLGLPELLRANPAALGTGRRNGLEKSCIFIVQYGGASHIDTWDLKPDAPSEIRGPYKPIATRVPGLHISEQQPKLARLADRFCLIRSMSHRNSGHQDGMDTCLTGHSSPTERTPSFGSALAKVRPAVGNLPSYVWLQNLAGDADKYYRNGGFLGPMYGPMIVGKDMDNVAEPGFRMTGFDPPRDVTPGRLLERYQLLQALAGAGPARPAGWQRFQERALDLVTGPQARQAFDLEREPSGRRDRYGRHPLGQNLLLARRLVEAGVRLVSINAFCGVPPGEKFRDVQTWDSHGDTGVNQGGIFSTGRCGLGFAMPRVDEALSALLEDLEQRGLLKTTLVVVVGEFGRSPRMAGRGAPGRDHWPQCYTALLAGGGIKGCYVYGASDKIAAYVKDRPVSPEEFGATLFHALGVPPETRLGADGFTNPVSIGQPILDLFA